MKKYIRFRGRGAVIIEFDPSLVIGYRIIDIEEYENTYVLLAILRTNGEIEISSGSFDECHFVLNKIHEISEIHITDIK